jgi:hypothetical protein
MKKVIIVCVSGFLICTGFKNQNKQKYSSFQTPVTDYRDTYTGTYVCLKTTKSLSRNNNGMDFSSETTSIIVTKDAIDSVLMVDLGEKSVKVKLLGKQLRPYYRSEHSGGHFYALDSIGFTYSPARSVSYTYLGKKQ